MIKRPLNETERNTLDKLHQQNGIPGLSLRRFAISLVTVHVLMRQKLAVCDSDSRYRITEAGRRALVEGSYERQPQLMSPPKKARFAVKVGRNKPSPHHNGYSA